MPRSEESKQKISATLRSRVPEVLIQPEKRKCAACGKWKNSGRDFSWRKRRLASGITRLAPYPRCKQCERERAAAKRAAMSPEQRRQEDRYWYKRRRAKLKADSQGRVLADPFLDWYAQFPDGAEWKAEIPENIWRRVREAKNRRAELGDGKVRISIFTVDKILHAAGQHELLASMYPE